MEVFLGGDAATNSVHPNHCKNITGNTYTVALLQQHENILVLLACGCLWTKTTQAISTYTAHLTAGKSDPDKPSNSQLTFKNSGQSKSVA
jgi:hypothetical protein